MQADRGERHEVFAEKYQGSDLKRVNARALSAHMSETGELSPEMLRELGTKAETANPWYYGVYTLLRVRAPNTSLPRDRISTETSNSPMPSLRLR